MTYDLFLEGPNVYVPVLLISLLITLVAYGAFPLLFAIIRKKIITKKKYTLLSYVINFLVCLVFFALSDSTPGAPYILWTSVFTAAGLKILDTKSILITSAEEAFLTREVSVSTIDSSSAVSTPPVSKQRYCKLCGGAINPETKVCKKCGKQYFRLHIGKSNVFFIIVAVLALALTFASLYRINQYQQEISRLDTQILEYESTLETKNLKISQLQAHTADQNERIRNLLSENSAMKSEIKFYDSHVVFVLDDNTRRYHKYDCVVFQYSSDFFWAYNTEAAISKGFEPCFSCCE